MIKIVEKFVETEWTFISLLICYLFSLTKNKNN